MRPHPSPPRPRPAADDGAQALELALVLPAVLLLAALVVAVGQVVLSLAGTHQLAIIAARTAAVAHDDAVHDLLVDADVAAVDISPATGSRRPGDLVTVAVTRPLRLLLLDTPVELTARASFRTEDVP